MLKRNRNLPHAWSLTVTVSLTSIYYLFQCCRQHLLRNNWGSKQMWHCLNKTSLPSFSCCMGEGCAKTAMSQLWFFLISKPSIVTGSHQFIHIPNITLTASYCKKERLFRTSITVVWLCRLWLRPLCCSGGFLLPSATRTHLRSLKIPQIPARGWGRVVSCALATLETTSIGLPIPGVMWWNTWVQTSSPKTKPSMT